MGKTSNIYKDKKRGTWFYVASLGKDRFGKRIQRTKRGFRTSKEARAAYLEEQKNYKESNGCYLKGIKFGYFYEKYFFPWYKTITVEKTYYKTDRTLQRSIEYFKNMQLENIRPIHIQEFHQYLINECFSVKKNEKDKPLSSNYIKQMFSKLRVVFKRAETLEIIDSNPVDSLGKIRVVKPKVNFWTYQEFKQVYSYSLKNDFYEAFYKRMMRFLFVTGLRSEEIFALQWQDVNFKGKTININKSIFIRTRTNYEFSDTKNASSNRMVSIDDKTVEELKEWKKEQGLIGEIDFVFSFDGLPPSPRTFLTRIKNLSEAAGVKPLHLHGLRHSHVAFLVEHNQNIYAVSKRLGHSSIKTTLDKYGHLYPDTNQQLAEEFSKFNI